MSNFVGRETEMRGALNILKSENDGIVLDVVGVHGIGKTVFLDQLAGTGGALDQVRVFRIDMKRHGLGEGFSNDYGAKATAAVLSETLNRSRELMGLFAEQRSREFDTFRQMSMLQTQRVKRWQGKNELYVGRRSRIGRADLTVNMTDEVVKQEIRDTQGAIDDAFVEAWTEFTARRRVLITADTFELVADDEMGHWMTRLAKRLPNTLVIFARTPSEHSLSAGSTGFKQIFLANFSCDEVTKYLQVCLAPSTLQPGIAEVVHGFTDGHPGGVSLIADLILERGDLALDPVNLRRILDRLPTDPNQRWAELVRLILKAVHEPILLRAVNAASLTTTFDAPLLSELIEAGDTGHHDTEQRPVGEFHDIGEVIARLVGLRLLQHVPALSGEPSGRFRLHEFLRLSVAARLRILKPKNWLELQRVATQHYFRKLTGWEDDPYTSYGAWYRFEDPEWQECKREWLRHSAALTGARAVTRARFTLVFLEAFWWWGYYLPFPFNRQLLEAWSRAIVSWERPGVTLPVDLTHRRSEDQQLLDALTFLLNNYPVSHLKPASAPWNELRERLLLIRRLCGLTQISAATTVTAEEQDEMKRANAFITIFLAHTRRFLNPADPKAESYYQDAGDAFEEMDDDWNVAWIHYERADLAVERDDFVLAIERVCQGARRARDLALQSKPKVEWDHELLANMHRTRADIHWFSGEFAEAGTEYGRAVAHAYWFQGDPHAPDEYTQQFYVEITTRAAERIVALSTRTGDATPFVTRLLSEVPGSPSDTIPTAALDSDIRTVRWKLFLPGPADDELRMEDTPFMAKWSILHEDHIDPSVTLAHLIGEES